MAQKNKQELRPIVLSAVKAIMKAHLEDLQKQGLLFRGQIMDVDISEKNDYLDFKFSGEFKKFVEERIKEGSLRDGLSNKIVIIIEDKGNDSDGSK